MLKGKVAVVTGAGRGIGLSIAVALAEAGADIALFDVNPADLAAAKATIEAKGVRALTAEVDVTNPASVGAAVDRVAAELGAPLILINNAGITKDNLLMRMTDDEWNKVLAVNLTGAFNCTRATMRHMTRERWGRIVNISSVVGVMGNAGQANYAASKAGLIGFTKAVAKELASRSVNVNAIAPGYIATKMTENLPEKARETLVSLIPLKRLGTPEDIAKTAIFLCSPASDYITGQVIHVDGGMVM
ncbi:MAG: 3-oxoacyl-[acyl-carrier-protein] reductase [Candidatus Brocadiia bacterium]